MPTISIDFETRSPVDLRKHGVYPYAVHDDTDVWCMAYALDSADVDLWVPGDPVPDLFYEAATDPAMQYRAWNATFERIIWRHILSVRYGFPMIELPQWHDTMAEAALLGMPAGLKKAAAVLKVAEQKDDGGYKLMMQMAKPRKPRKAERETLEPGQLFWWDDDDRKERLFEYCRQDVRTERDIANKIAPLVRGMGQERAVWLLDQEINDRGVPADMPLVDACRVIADEGVARASIELHGITDGLVGKPTSVAKMKDWLESQGVSLESLNKNAIRDLLEENHLTPEVRRLLEIRQDTGKSSVAKLDAITKYASVDSRARGMHHYHAAHTGRWGGRGPQPHNIPRPENEHAEGCSEKPCTCGGVERFIPLIMRGDFDTIEMTAPPVTVVSDVLRSCFKASDGCKLIGGDFSSIEMHVLAWLAGQEDSATYFEMAGEIFDMDPEDVKKGTVEYMVGKVAILACGYQMGDGTFKETVKEWTGLDIEEEVAEDAVKAYRKKHKDIVAVWAAYNNAVLSAVRSPGQMFETNRVRFMTAGNFLWARLPSGRKLAYPLPEIRMRSLPEPYEHVVKPTVIVRGVNSMTGQWEGRALYGGLIAENVTQAVARDILAEAMLRLDAAGYPIIMHVHDEVLCEVEQGSMLNTENFDALMSVTPEWAEGCYIAAEVWDGERFRK